MLTRAIACVASLSVLPSSAPFAASQSTNSTTLAQRVRAVRGDHLVGDAAQPHRVVRHADDAAVALRRADRVARGQALLELDAVERYLKSL